MMLCNLREKSLLLKRKTLIKKIFIANFTRAEINGLRFYTRVQWLAPSVWVRLIKVLYGGPGACFMSLQCKKCVPPRFALKTFCLKNVLKIVLKTFVLQIVLKNFAFQNCRKEF